MHITGERTAQPHKNVYGQTSNRDMLDTYSHGGDAVGLEEKNQTPEIPDLTKPRLLTPVEVGLVLGISPRTVLNGTGRKAKVPFPIPAVRVGHLIRFKSEAVLEYLRNL